MICSDSEYGWYGRKGSMCRMVRNKSIGDKGQYGEGEKEEDEAEKGEDEKGEDEK